MAEKKTTAKKTRKPKEETKQLEQPYQFVHTEVKINEGETIDQFQARLQAELEKYEYHLTVTTQTPESLREEYKAVMGHLEVTRFNINRTAYDLKSEVTIDNKTYGLKLAASKIAKLLSSEKVGIDEVENMLNVVKFWNNPEEKVLFGILHITMLKLSSKTYGSMAEWEDANVANKYLMLLNDDYNKDILPFKFWDAKRNLIETIANSNQL